MNDKQTRRPIGPEEVRGAMQTLRKYQQGKANLERRLIANEDWWKLRQWRQFDDKGNRLDDRPASGWLFNVIMGKHADAILSYPEANVRPREQEDLPQAQALSAIVPCILEQNKFEEIYSDSCWQKMTQGTSVWGVYWDPEKLSGLGEISIRQVDLLNLFWEPGVRDLQDSKNVFYTQLADDEILLSQYPQLEGKLHKGAFSPSRYRTDDTVDQSERTLVVDWYYKRHTNGRTVLHYCKFAGDEVLYATENDDYAPSVRRVAYDGAGGAQREVFEPLRQSAQEAGLYDDGEYPFVVDRLFPVEGSICGYGYIDLGKSAQEQIDRLNQAIVKNAIMAASPRWFHRTDGSVNEQEYADWTKPFVHVDGNLAADSLQQVKVQALPGVYVQILRDKIDELKWVTGNSDAVNGQTSAGVTAASAIAALQEAGGRASRASNASAYRAFARLVRMVIERIRQFYDLPRRFRITGADGQEAYISYSNEQLKRQGPGALRRPVFDITVSAQRHTEYTKLSQNELALQFYQMGFFRAENALQALACLDMMDFEGKQALKSRIAQNAGRAMAQQQRAQQPSPAARGVPAQPDAAHTPRMEAARARAQEAGLGNA